jgi:cold shock CspA family protein
VAEQLALHYVSQSFFLSVTAMEGCASNFEYVLNDFAQRMHNAKYITVDMELTGADLEREPDNYAETAQERLSKLSRIAQQHVPIQIGFTIVSLDGTKFVCSTYNFYAFPWAGPENAARAPKFACQVSALKFNARNNVDFNKWVRDGVSYMTREDESNYLQHPASQTDSDLPSKVGLLRLWKLICDAQLPLVVHSPLDLFFLLACFEQAHLPSESPQEMAALIRRCSPCVFDTAYLHGFLGCFKRLGLSEFLQEAKVRHTAEVEHGAAEPCSFVRDNMTDAAFNNGDIHTAGYDSLLTAELFAYLVAISPDLLETCANRLYLYKSIEYIDLSLAALSGDVGGSFLDASCETPFVATLAVAHDKETPKLIAKAGFKYHWMDSLHVLVIVKAPCTDALADVARLRHKLPSIAHWAPFLVWRFQTLASAQSTFVSRCSSDVSSESSAPLDDRETASAHISNTRSWLGEIDLGEQGISCTHASPVVNNASEVACSKARTSLDKRDIEEQRFLGVIKSFRPLPQGFGFIECAETFARFQRDVFLHHSQIGRCTVGQNVSFMISTNSSGQPQANKVTAVDLCSCSPESTADDSVFGRSLCDDDDTTRGSVSDGEFFGVSHSVEKCGDVHSIESDLSRIGIL